MPLKILLVDDSPSDREYGKQALADLETPTEVACADDWPSARCRLTDDPATDLILLDFRLPMMNGLEVLAELRDRVHPPVVMITGQEDLVVAVETLRAGAYDYVAKTVDWGEPLRATIRRVAARIDLEKQLDAARQALCEHAADLERQVALRTEVVRMQAEQIEELYLKADDAARIESQIIDNTSHELRTPLNAIIGFASVLDEELPANASPESRRMLETIRENAGQLLRLVESLLDLGDLRSGQVSPSTSWFSLADLARELRGEAEMLNATKGLRLEWASFPAGVRVEHDREKIRVIAYHLLSNAIKFTHEGRVGVTLAATRRGGVRIVVEDTGVGCSSGARVVIFEDFRQADGSSTRQFGGLGLGLGIVRRYATLLGGTIDAEPVSQGGLRIVVDLPPVWALRRDAGPLDASRRQTDEASTQSMASFTEAGGSRRSQRRRS